jgi:hypothetical protein
MSKQIAREKIARYNAYIHSLNAEKTLLSNFIEAGKLSDISTQKAKQRIFELEVTIQGHEAFKQHYEARLNPSTYKKRIE